MTLSNSNKYKCVQPELCNLIISSNFHITEEGEKSEMIKLQCTKTRLELNVPCSSYVLYSNVKNGLKMMGNHLLLH